MTRYDDEPLSCARRPWLSMPCNACSIQVVRPLDLCEHDDPLCPSCCGTEHEEAA